MPHFNSTNDVLLKLSLSPMHHSISGSVEFRLGIMPSCEWILLLVIYRKYALPPAIVLTQCIKLLQDVVSCHPSHIMFDIVHGNARQFIFVASCTS